NLQGFFEVRDRVVKLSIGHQQVTQIVMGLGVIGIDSQGFEVLSFGGLRLALSGECQSKVVVRLEVIGLKTQRLAKAGDRVGEFSLESQRLAEVAVRRSIVRRNL